MATLQPAVLALDFDSVITAILQGHGIAFPSENIFYAGPGTSKRSIIESRLKEHGQSARDLAFVDDQVDTLIKVLPTGVTCILAGWGHNDDEQRAKARANRIEIADLPGFIQKWQ